MVYTHQDYVEAAGECLQIETDLEEILQTHPSIMDDIKRERKRMEGERDKLLARLECQPGVEVVEGQHENADMSQELEEDSKDSRDQPNNDKESFHMKVIASEVIAQMKSDLHSCVNVLMPKSLQEKIRLQFKQHIQPTLAPAIVVVKGMLREVKEMAHRYLIAFGVLKAGGGAPVDHGERVEESVKEQISPRQEAQPVSVP